MQKMPCGLLAYKASAIFLIFYIFVIKQQLFFFFTKMVKMQKMPCGLLTYKASAIFLIFYIFVVFYIFVAKLQLSENNTKQIVFFVFIVERE